MEILEILARPIFLSWIDWLKMFEQWIEIRHNWHWQNYWFYIPVLPQQARAFLTKAMGCCSSTTSVELPATTERGSFLIAKWFENCGDNRSCDFWVTFVGGDWDSASFFGGSVVVLTPNRRCFGHVIKPVQVILNPVINAIAPITQVNLTTWL